MSDRKPYRIVAYPTAAHFVRGLAAQDHRFQTLQFFAEMGGHQFARRYSHVLITGPGSWKKVIIYGKTLEGPGPYLVNGVT